MFDSIPFQFSVGNLHYRDKASRRGDGKEKKGGRSNEAIVVISHCEEYVTRIKWFSSSFPLPSTFHPRPCFLVPAVSPCGKYRRQQQSVSWDWMLDDARRRDDEEPDWSNEKRERKRERESLFNTSKQRELGDGRVIARRDYSRERQRAREREGAKRVCP